MAMLAMHREWQRAIHPVSTGRAEWLTDGFFQVMRECDAAINEQEAKAAEQRVAAAAAKRR